MLDFSLTEEQKTPKEAVRKFAEKDKAYRQRGRQGA